MTNRELTAASGTDTPPSKDKLFNALSHERRRYALHYLKQRDEPVPIRELAEQVAAWENDKSIQDLTSQERKRVYIALYQSHLSTMDEEGLIEYNEDEGIVKLPESMADLDLYLEIVPNNSISWSTYYAGLTFANALLLLLAYADISPFSAVPDLVWGGFILVSFGISSVVQHYRTRQMHIGDDGPPPELQSKQ